MSQISKLTSGDQIIDRSYRKKIMYMAVGFITAVRVISIVPCTEAVNCKR